MQLSSTTNKSKLQADALGRAQAAADIGDAAGMFQGLCDAMVFEAFLSSFSSRYPEIKDDVHDIISAATDALYERVKSRKPVAKVESYLWKMINERMSKFSQKKIAHTGPNAESLGYIQTAAQSSEEREAADLKKDEALSIAFTLLPRLGQTNVQEVMRYVLVAIQNGIHHVDYGEIADALGITRGVAKTSLRRGFERLTRIAKEENLVDTNFSFPLSESMDYLAEVDDESEQY